MITQIREIGDGYERLQMSGARYFPMLECLEAQERTLKAEKRRHETERAPRHEAVSDLEEKWKDPSFTLDQRQAAVAKSLTAVIIHPARPGERFDPDKIEPIWCEDEDE